jgi:Ni/Fe-hydrogenase subunit HybB-like protein
MSIAEQQLGTQRPIQPGTSEPIILGTTSFVALTDQVTSVVLTRPTPVPWMFAFAVGLLLVSVLLISLAFLFYQGIGIFGTEIPIAWAFPITNFVWWIGIGHAGTLISAILLLLNQQWRNSINRFAEAMTIFAVMCAGLMPLSHLGRPWIFYWLFPYPNTMHVQPQFRSPLVWDVFAVSTYFTISLLFWYLGMIPDIASLRDRATKRGAKTFYGICALGWRGASRHWRFHEMASLLLAGLATPLVLSVHTVVSFDFTIAILPGWHSTIFPPYFVDGAIYSGFAMVLMLAIPLRKIYGLENLITERHLNNCAKIMLATGLILAYAYAIEPFTAWYGGDRYEMAVVHYRAVGPESWTYWLTLTCNVFIPQLLWFRKFRVEPKRLFFVSSVILYGMWMERFMIIITALHRDFLPSAWANFTATRWDFGLLFGSVGLFLVCFLLFVRFLPMIPMFELRGLLPFSRPAGGTES